MTAPNLYFALEGSTFWRTSSIYWFASRCVLIFKYLAVRLACSSGGDACKSLKKATCKKPWSEEGTGSFAGAASVTRSLVAALAPGSPGHLIPEAAGAGNVVGASLLGAASENR